MQIIILLLTALLVGCNSDDGGNYIETEPQQQTQDTQALRHDFTSIAPLYSSPYTTPLVDYVEEAKTINILELKRGQLSCVGECELPITGYTLTSQGSTMFSIGTDTILTDIMINSSARSSICYEMQSGWFVVQYFYRGEVTYKESQSGCYSYLIDTVVENWEYGTVMSANADVRGSGFVISEVEL